MADRVEAAEVHITHLVRTVEELSDQVALQGLEIDRLKARLQMLIDRLSKHDSGEESEIPLLDQRPPHY
jgi:SlyX protein